MVIQEKYNVHDFRQDPDAYIDNDKNRKYGTAAEKAFEFI
jgi:hypothetical protein